MDPLTWPNQAEGLTIPEGISLTFCWTAERAYDGGTIEAYRYGWDVIDPGNPASWDVDFTAYDGTNVCSEPRIFSSAGIHFFVIEVVDNEGASTRIILVIRIITGPSSFDIMPGACKNPFNAQRKGPVRTVIPGRIGMDVSEIDISSLYLWVDGNVVQPVRIMTRDIASPLINGDPCECPPAGPDGIDDLLIFFDAGDIVRAMGPIMRDETRELSVYGALTDGDDFRLTDCVTIVGVPRTGEDPALLNKDAVLVALQKGYNEKNFRMVSAILDDDFTFFFSEKDFQSGVVPFRHWGREEELAATANLFNIDTPADALSALPFGGKIRHARTSEGATWGRIKAAFFDGGIDAQTSINVQVLFPPGVDNWTAVAPPDPTQYPGETWYQKTSYYFMTVRAGEYTFITDGLPQAAFVVRYSETKGGWQLVQWRDDI